METAGVLSLRPGDTLVVSTQAALSAKQEQELKQALMLRFPEAARVVVLPLGITLSVVRSTADKGAS